MPVKSVNVPTFPMALVPEVVSVDGGRIFYATGVIGQTGPGHSRFNVLICLIIIMLVY